MKILIFGAGAIGVYLGCKLHSRGHEVYLLGREKLRRLHDTILIDKELYSMPKRLYSLPRKSRYEYVFITSKLFDLEKNMNALMAREILFENLAIIQNGLVNNSMYNSLTKSGEFASISVFEGFRLAENQLIINQSSTGWKTNESLLGKKIASLLLDTGINCTTDKNIESIRAEKTIMNCSVNLLSAIEKKTFFELCLNKKDKNRIELLFDEAYEVISKKYKIKSKDKLKRLFYEIISPMKHYSSTYQDALSKRRTEVDFLNRLIVEWGKEEGVATPENKKVYEEFINQYPKSR